MMAAPKRLLFYCQHLLGVGHLARSLALVNAFTNAGWDVDFVQGGPDIGRAPKKANVCQLPALLMTEETSALYDPEHRRSVAQIFQEREAMFTELLKGHAYQAVITELFPFGRGKFKDEIRAILKLARMVNPQVQVFSSVRDILVERQDRDVWEAKVVKVVEKEFDHVLVHSDPQVVRFEETFASTPLIAARLHYTGFVTESGPRAESALRGREILLSFGGGAVGDELAMAVLRVVAHFPDFLFRVIAGPYTSADLRAHLHLAEAEHRNVRVENFLADFEGALATAALSISLAGYNTLMNLLATRTPALVLPYDRNHEQRMRAKKLEALGILRVLEVADLEAERLIAQMQTALGAQPIALDIGLRGAAESEKIVARICSAIAIGNEVTQ